MLIGAVRWLGSLGDYPAAELISQFDCSPQPCWHGIQIGVTSVEEASQILTADAAIRLVNYNPEHQTVCWAWLDEEGSGNRGNGCYTSAAEAQYLPLYFSYVDPPLTLGDILLSMGRPITSYTCNNFRVANIYSQRMIVSVANLQNDSWIAPELQVKTIGYLAPHTDQASYAINYRWTGFSRWANSYTACP